MEWVISQFQFDEAGTCIVVSLFLCVIAFILYCAYDTFKDGRL